MKTIAITGGIGSGKSTVMKLLASKGYVTLDADQLSRKIMSESAVVQEISKKFGLSILTPDGHIDRKKLGSMIFENSEMRVNLQQILHPRIESLFIAECNYVKNVCSTAWIFYEASLIVEAARHKDFDALVVVTCSIETRRQRLMANRNMALTEIESVVGSQMSDQEKIAFADFVLDNSGNLNELTEKTNSLLESLVYLKDH